MLVTIENQTSRIINKLDAIVNNQTGGVADLTATSLGVRTDPLPPPFDQVGELAANGDPGDSIQRAMHIGDFRKQHNIHTALGPDDLWNQVVQNGTVTFAVAAETGRVDVEEEYDLAIA